jgi:hypothetical protein
MSTAPPTDVAGSAGSNYDMGCHIRPQIQRPDAIDAGDRKFRSGIYTPESLNNRLEPTGATRLSQHKGHDPFRVRDL